MTVSDAVTEIADMDVEVLIDTAFDLLGMVLVGIIIGMIVLYIVNQYWWR